MSLPVISATGHVLLYGLAAAISPLALTATLAAVRSGRPRTNGVAFLAGFVLGTAVACVLGLILGQAAIDRLESADTIKALSALFLGIALLVAGLRGRRLPQGSLAKSSRGAAALAELRHVGPRATLSMAGLLGFGGPKRLILTLLAMTSVSKVDLGAIENLTLIALYIAIATLIVSVPVCMVVVAGNRAASIIDRGESWALKHRAGLRVWLGTGLGTALVIDGLLQLNG